MAANPYAFFSADTHLFWKWAIRAGMKVFYCSLTFDTSHKNKTKLFRMNSSKFSSLPIVICFINFLQKKNNKRIEFSNIFKSSHPTNEYHAHLCGSRVHSFQRMPLFCVEIALNNLCKGSLYDHKTWNV